MVNSMVFSRCSTEVNRVSLLAAPAGEPVWPLLGAKGLTPMPDPANMPPPQTNLLGGQLAWRQHDGGHTDGPNWKYFIPWADKFLKHAGAESRP